MPQVFHRRSNTIARTGILGLVIFVCLSGWALHAIFWSPYTTLVNVPIPQPVPFSHQHHVGDLGIDCRYCHSAVERSSSAGLPPTETCMTCHSRLFTSAPLLAPVRDSLATGTPIRWNRVNYVPDFVFFNHGIHINKGIGCTTCHGEVDHMPLTWKSHTLYMKWCLDCHRNPEKFIRPRAKVFDQEWSSPTNQATLGRELVAKYHVNTTQLMDCSMCHR
jgi:Cytochrome c7 and related cytochrome c